MEGNKTSINRTAQHGADTGVFIFAKIMQLKDNSKN